MDNTAVTNSIVTVVQPAGTPTQTRVSPPPLQKELHRVNLGKFLTAQSGKFVGVDFIKQDGCHRSLNGRLGVRKYLSGGQNKVEAADRPYLVVYDVKTAGYRAVNLATVSCVRAQNCVFSLVG